MCCSWCFFQQTSQSTKQSKSGDAAHPDLHSVSFLCASLPASLPASCCPSSCIHFHSVAAHLVQDHAWCLMADALQAGTAWMLCCASLSLLAHLPDLSSISTSLHSSPISSTLQRLSKHPSHHLAWCRVVHRRRLLRCLCFLCTQQRAASGVTPTRWTSNKQPLHT